MNHETNSPDGDISDLGRLILASGAVLRLHLEPDGLHVTVPELSLSNGDVRTYDAYHHLGHLGAHFDQNLMDDDVTSESLSDVSGPEEEKR